MKTETINGLRQISAADGKYLRKGDNYFTKCILLPSDSESDFEECDKPSEEIEEAKKAKIAEIEAADDLSNEFFVSGISMWLKKDDRTALVSNTIPALEDNGETTTKLWGVSNGIPMSFTIPISALKQMLAALELYAKGTYDVTMTHKAIISSMTTLEDIQSFDAGKDYPIKLRFTL